MREFDNFLPGLNTLNLIYCPMMNKNQNLVQNVSKPSLFLLILMAFTACQSNISNENTAGSDSLFNQLSSLEPLEINAIDSVYLETLESELNNLNSLTPTVAKELFAAYTVPETEIYQSDFVSDFLKIDSLKKNDGYDLYTQKLDIGMLRDARAFKSGLINIDNEKAAALWGIWYSSFEACPYFHGVDLYLSVFENRKLKQTYKVGSNFSSVDPPVAVYNPISSKIENGQLTVKMENNDIDLVDDITEEVVKNVSQINNYEL